MSIIETIRTALYGSPPSQSYQPSKEGVIDAFDEVVQAVTVLSGGIIGSTATMRATKSLLDAVSPADDTLGLVYADSNSDLNGIYHRTGGAWVPTGLLGTGPEGPGPTSETIDDATAIAVAAAAAAEASATEVGDAVLEITALGEYTDLLDEHVLNYTPAKNIYIPDDRIFGQYLDTGTSGNLLSAVGFDHYKLTVSPGQIYTISAGATMPTGIGFYANDAATSVVASGYVGTAGTAPRTVTVPAGATVMRFNTGNTFTPTPANIQAELSTVATAYEAWHPPIPTVRSEAVEEGPLQAYEQSVTSDNLFVIANIRVGKYLESGTGNVLSAANWACSEFIPVTAGMQYTVQGQRGQTGISFFTSASDSAAIAGSYSAGAGTRTVRAPRGATHAVIDVYKAADQTYSNVQFEAGPLASPYKLAGAETHVKRSFLTPAAAASAGRAILNIVRSAANGSSYLEMPLGTNTLRINISPFRPRNHTASDVFNFSSEMWNGVTHRSAGDDDVAPYRMYNGFVVGANHGWYMSRCTVAAHGKTNIDVGSIYSDGTSQWVIVDIPATNQITLLNRGATNVPLGNSLTMTHVSGGTNTASFSSGTVVNPTWHFPVYKNRKFAIQVDGVEITDYAGQYAYEENVTFSESYEVMSKDNMLNWLITQVGTATDIVEYSGTADFAVSMTYRFDRYGGCAITTDLLALQTIPLFTDIMFAQSEPLLPGVSGAVKYYIPKALSFVDAAVTYDFRSPRDMTGFTAPSGLNLLVSGRCEPAGHLVDRLVMLNNDIGLATGMLPELDGGTGVRRTNNTDKAIYISPLGKIYIQAIDDVAGTGTRSLAAGEYFSAVVYKKWFARSADRTAAYPVRSALADYLYCDWHDVTKIDRVLLDPDYHGRTFTIVESRNVTVRSEVATNSVVFDVAAAGGYAFAVLKFVR